MALNTKTPILPMVVKGGFEFKPKNRLYIKPGTVSIEVGKPISVDKFSTQNENIIKEKNTSKRNTDWRDKYKIFINTYTYIMK